MTHEPFLVIPIRSWRDCLLARHRARQVAQLLRFAPQEVIFVAAGAFAIAHKAGQVLGRGELAFSLADRQLHVFARPIRRLAKPPSGLYTLQRDLPKDDRQMSGEDIAWLIAQVRQLAPSTSRSEVIKANEEVLCLLRELHAVRSSSQSNKNPSAA